MVSLNPDVYKSQLIEKSVPKLLELDETWRTGVYITLGLKPVPNTSYVFHG
jgi:hypothetical protein